MGWCHLGRCQGFLVISMSANSRAKGHPLQPLCSILSLLLQLKPDTNIAHMLSLPLMEGSIGNAHCHAEYGFTQTDVIQA